MLINFFIHTNPSGGGRGGLCLDQREGPLALQLWGSLHLPIGIQSFWSGMGNTCHWPLGQEILKDDDMLIAALCSEDPSHPHPIFECPFHRYGLKGWPCPWTKASDHSTLRAILAMLEGVCVHALHHTMTV